MKSSRSMIDSGVLFMTLGLCVLAISPHVPTVAQVQTINDRHVAGRLRQDLEKALNGEFEIVRHEITRRSNYHGGGRYWLVHVKPSRSGRFAVKYKHSVTVKNDPASKFVEREIAMRVGERGCQRVPEFMSSHFMPCLGDTIILPFLIGDSLSDEEGSFAFSADTIGNKTDMTTDLQEAPSGDDNTGRVPNPVEEHLKYVGSSVRINFHRAPGYTAQFHATFEAVKPASFNLALNARVAVSSLQGRAFAGSIPIIIVPRRTPVTWLAPKEFVMEHTERFSSCTGNNFLTTPVIMQPGERVTLLYYSLKRHGSAAESQLESLDLQRQVSPAIRQLPFSVDRSNSFNEWIIDYLPVSKPSKRP